MDLADHRFNKINRNKINRNKINRNKFNIWNKPEYCLMFGFFVVILESGVFVRGLEYGD